MHGKVELSGVNTSQLTVLGSDEIQRLLERCHEGDRAAREKLIEGNLRLVLSVIQKFIGRSGGASTTADDLFQVGCIGLIKAIDNFDLSQNVRFSTYGVPMIIGEIRRYLRDNSSIRVSRSMRDTAYKVLQAKEQLQFETGAEPTIDMIAKRLEISREEIVNALDAIQEPVSLYDPVYQDGRGGDSLCVMDQVGDSKNTDEVWLEHIALADAVAKLNERERRILALRFYEGKTQMEVSGEIGISQAQVSRLEKNAIRQIRRNV
ncbi:MAG: RNA polymerase sporulation sigma factor SigG [Oscillospiraceae bacterium]|jgi:RNA polymerase sporulation-specific sigma factor|nr:RNA polymerase sporulation sigma factor SigG [Oscillospiraceae bacterium]